MNYRIDFGNGQVQEFRSIAAAERGKESSPSRTSETVTIPTINAAKGR